jgi:hypothetical protein
MSIALTVLLNISAVAALLGLLTATMRLPYRFPSTSHAVDTRAKDRVKRRPQARATGQRSSERHDVPEPIYSQ